ncbi:MAG: hypothetical protein KDE32_04715 [Novosphingobium sp.]|nr:hypothetical protein [Novosphingobium sp.]
MKKFAIVLGAAVLASSMAPAIALADEATAPVMVEVKRGDMVYSADGKRIGNIYRVTETGDAQIIYRSKMITITNATLSQVEGKLQTSLTLAEVRALG